MAHQLDTNYKHCAPQQEPHSPRRTSSPDTTRPKATLLLSKASHWSRHTMNWQPFLLGPEGAMATTPRSCRNRNASSSKAPP